MRRSQLAINAVSTRHKNVEEALDAYATAGFRNVEFVFPLRKEDGGEYTPDEIRRLLQQHDLRAIGGFQTHVECFTAPESRRANHAIHLRNAQFLHELGGETLVVGTDGPAEPSVEALATVADVLGGLAGQIEGLDVDIALEFNWSPLVKSLRAATRIAELANHPRLGVLFDPAHYYVTPTKFEDLDAGTVRWIKHVHLDDMRDKPGDLSDCNADRVLPGQGVLDLRALIVALERYGYDGFFSIEMFNAELWALPAAEAARRCYASLLPFCE